MELLTPVTFGPRTAPNRVMFGPHVTNLGADDRSIPPRQVAYYERRARGEQHLEIHRPNLETLYLNLTGRALRE